MKINSAKMLTIKKSKIRVKSKLGENTNEDWQIDNEINNSLNSLYPIFELLTSIYEEEKQNGKQNNICSWLL